MPSLEDLGTKQIVSGTPDPEDIIPYFDLSEFGNNPVKKTTVGALVDATPNLTQPGNEEKILKGNASGNIVVNSLTAAVSLEVGVEDGLSGVVTIIHSSGAPGRIANDDAANGVQLNFPTLTATTATLGAIIVKATTGDPATTGPAFCINTFDNTLKVYADGAWRAITTW